VPAQPGCAGSDVERRGAQDLRGDCTNRAEKAPGGSWAILCPGE